MSDNFIIQAPGKVKLTADDNFPNYLLYKINEGEFDTFHSKEILLNVSGSQTSFQEGKIFYDPNWRTIAANIDDDVTLQIGQEDINFVFNNSGVDILNGQPVYVTGSGWDEATGEITETVALAKADNIATSKVFGIATQNINNNSYGIVTNRGKINDLDTLSMGNESDILYLSPYVSGGLTNIIPEYPNVRFPVGRLLIRDSTIGRISVNLDESSFGSYTTSLASSLYFITTVSPISSEFLTLSYTNTGVQEISSVTLHNNTVLIDSFITDTQLGVSTIPSGVWSFNITAYVDSNNNDTQFIVEVYKYHLNNTETLLFSVNSSDINDLTLKDQVFTFAAPEYVVSTTDRLLVKLYGTTNRNNNTVLYYAMGDGLSPFFTPPLKIKHSSLSNFNEDPDVQHLSSSEKTKIEEISQGYLELSNDISYISFGSNNETIFIRDGSHILGMRNSSNPQELRIYGTYTNSDNYERLFFKYNSLTATYQIGTQKGGVGGTARTLDILTDNVVRMNISQNGITLPILTSVQRDAIVSPSSSLTLYNSSQQKLNTYNSVNSTWYSSIGSSTVYEVVSLTQAEYDAISPNQNTIYIIVDAPFPPLDIPLKNITASYQALDTDGTINVLSNSVTVTLPSSLSITGRVLIIKNSGVGTVTINSAAGNEYIDGSTTSSLNSQYAVLRIQSIGADGWIVI